MSLIFFCSVRVSHTGNFLSYQTSNSRLSYCPILNSAVCFRYFIRCVFLANTYRDPFKAFEEANRFNATELEDEYNHQSNLELASVFANHKTEPDNRSRSSSVQENDQGPTFEEISLPKVSARGFFLTEGNWRTLLGTSLAWFLLDFA